MDKASLDELHRAAGPDRVITSEVGRVARGYDATKIAHVPDVVIQPRDADEVAAVLQLANKRRFPVYPRGAGTGMTGGAIPLAGGVVLDMCEMNSVLAVDRESLTARVQPGVLVGDFQRAVARMGLLYPPDPASADISTIGGNAAEDAGGLRAVKYGVTHDYVLALEAVTGAGQVIHTGRGVAKSVTGYDLTRLLVGSEGTLAIFTELVVKLLPLPEAASTSVAYFSSTEAAMEGVTAILANRMLPRAIEYLDRSTLNAVRAGQAMDIPERAAAVLLVELDGPREVVDRQSADLVQLLNRAGGLDIRTASDDRQREALWQVRRNTSVSLRTISPDRINEDICVPLSRLADTVREVERVAERSGVPIATFGHAGDGNLHVNILVDGDNPDHVRASDGIVQEVFGIAISMGGTLSGEHGIGITKRSYLTREVPPGELELMKQVKRIFDPSNVLNPGKVLP